MPLIICPDCNQMISDAAPYCPKCGRPSHVSIAKKPKKIWTYIVVGIIGLWAIGLIGRSVGKSPSPSIKNSQSLDKQALSQEQIALLALWEKYSKPGVSVKDSKLAVTADELARDYKTNEVAADVKYKGKAMVIKGYIHSISKDFTDEAYLTLEADNKSFTHVRASLSPVQPKNAENDGLTTPVTVEEKVSSATKGDIVSLLCIGKGYFVMTPTLGDCIVMQVESLKPPKHSK